MKFLLSLYLLIHLMTVSAQIYLNDTATYNSNWCGYTSVYELNKQYYVMGGTINFGHNNDMSLLLGLHKSNGDKISLQIDYDTLNDQKIFGGINKLIYNERGNFVYLYNNCEQGISCYPRLKEISPTGFLINDISYLPILDSFAFKLFDFNNIMQKKDSTYVIALDIQDPIRFANPNLGGGGVLYIHLDKDFNVLDTVPYFGSGSHQERGYLFADIVELDNGNIVFMIYETLQDPSDPESQIVFMTIDEQGNILNKKHYTDGQMAVSPFALTRTEDNGFLFTYVKSVNIDNSWINNDFLCKVDSNFNLVWKMSVDTLIHSGGFKYLEKNIAPTLDGSYITAGGSGTFEPDYQSTALLSKFDENGQIEWQRHHFLLSEVSPTAPITTEINDVIATSDSGYCMVGQVFDYPVFGTSPISFYGYLVKTNCLGFLGNAVASAGFSYEDEFAVRFYNTSMQAGSYFWDFGDGTSLTTDEYVDTVVHSYTLGTEPYTELVEVEVMLIAYGCYDSLGVRDADTVLFTVQPRKHQDPSVVTNGNGYFSIFPNPISAGSPLYVYLNGLNFNDGEVVLKIYGNDGEYVTKYILSASEGSYQVDNELPSGVYMLVLEQGGEVLEMEKLVVQ